MYPLCATDAGSWQADQLAPVKMLSKSIRTEVVINAEPAKVWSVFINWAAYSEWNSFIRALAGEPREGAVLQLAVQPPGKGVSKFQPRVLKGGGRGREEAARAARSQTAAGFGCRAQQRRPPAQPHMPPAHPPARRLGLPARPPARPMVLDVPLHHPFPAAEANKEFRWQGKLAGLPGLFTGEHYFTFEDAGEGRTKLLHGEVRARVRVFSAGVRVGDLGATF